MSQSTPFFALSEDHVAIRDMARAFASEQIAPHALEWDEKKHFPVAQMRAAAALGVDPGEIARHADTVSLCLSKGLSAPVGAVLAGARPVMERARGLRRMLGGTQRQAGIMAAAGLEAVRTMGARLAEDHARARRLSDGVNRLAPALSASVPQTNIVQVETAASGMDNAQWTAALAAADPLIPVVA